ncbi:hypothetical protein AB0393_28400 [Streptomyces cyaneofuscatus]|uniref:hypothetical protein n=1 Tax=Streptomyces cyaneofuscatus TaxID=66883 RepID=UPI003450DFEF
MARPLGRHQLAALSALARLNGGTWSVDCTWRLHSVAYTVRVLDTLVERGLATRTSATARYAITEQGFNRLGWFTCGRCTRLTRFPVVAEHGLYRRQVRCSWCATPEQARPGPDGGSASGGTREPAPSPGAVPA